MHITKFTILIIFKCKFSGVSAVTLLCDHLHDSSSCKTDTLFTLRNDSPSASAAAPGATILLSVSAHVTALGTADKWDRTAFVLL